MTAVKGPDSVGHQLIEPTSAPKPLSCVSCRQRKVKCNRINPCSHCQKARIQCVFPTRVRVSRAKQAGSKSRDLELLQRLSRLEGLVSKFDQEALKTSQVEHVRVASQVSDATAQPDSIPDDVPGKDAPGIRLDEWYASFIKRQETRKPYLSGEFWTSLCDEVGGLRQLLEDSGDEEDEFDDSTSNSTDTKHPSPNFIFNNFSTPFTWASAYPSDHHRSILCQIFFTNVDPVCKVSHKPTAMIHFEGSKDLIDESTGRYKFKSLEAIAFATYFATVTTLSSLDCLNYFGEEKDVLVDRYKRGTEAALSEADLMNSVEIITFKALILYIMTLRSHEKSRNSWTLIGVAVRIAHGLGLHRDGDGRAHSAFEAEMRRRLWWELVVLDMRASEDRGSEPMIAGNTFNTQMPLNINDEDFGYDSQHPLQERIGVTDITFCLISMDVSNTARKTNFVPPAQEHQPLTTQQKEDLVSQCCKRIENKYLAGSDPSDGRNSLLFMLGRLLILRLQSTIQYPLQSRSFTSKDAQRGQSLRTVVLYLELVEQMEEHKSTAGFTWFIKTYVPWHALAVALAELCNETQGPLADRAWAVINRGYEKWADRVADSKGGMLWRPIKSLLKSARAARQRAHEQLVEPQVEMQLPIFDLASHDVEITQEIPNLSLGESQNALYDHVMNDSIDQMIQPPHSLFGPDFFSLTDMPLSAAGTSDDHMNWNQFIIDFYAVGPYVTLDTIRDQPQ